MKEVREPIQVYLTISERSELDRLASRFGVSRSEILRRGVATLGATESVGHVTGPLADLVDDGLMTPARAARLPVPTTTPVAPLAEILDDLREDRADR